MIFEVGDRVHAEDITNGISGDGCITNIKYDAVAWDMEVTFDDKSKHHFYRFQLTKI